MSQADRVNQICINELMELPTGHLLGNMNKNCGMIIAKHLRPNFNLKGRDDCFLEMT